MDYQLITKDRELQSYCQQISGASWIAFDTEFVSEDTYHPELCLIQVATEQGLAVVDPQHLDPTVFWETICRGDQQTIVHAGREEMGFCWRAVGTVPRMLFDVQLGAGLVGLEYPASYSNLISKLLNKRLGKGETRTDWRRRPLTQQQLQYALQDVEYLFPIREHLGRQLKRLERTHWLEDEIRSWLQQLTDSSNRERWRRVSGISGLSSRRLAIVRELWRWRDQEAQRRDRPPKRILRDDLIVELARRESSDPQRIRAVRGLERRQLQNQLEVIGEHVQRALDLPEELWPQKPIHQSRPPFNLLGQFLSAALAALCREHEVAPSLVGGAQEVRNLLHYRLCTDQSEPPPALATGWRAKIVGDLIDELLQGRLSVGVGEALHSQPLTFIPHPRSHSAEPTPDSQAELD